MDWGNVTAEDLIDALREVDWSNPPRPLSEFFSRFTLPRSSAKWNSRLKCNLYYYRTNYFIMIIFILGLGFLRRPLAIVAAILTALSIAFLNDSFAGTFSEKVTRTVRQFSPHLAAKMRPPLTPVIRGRPSAKRAIHICGRPRWVIVLIFSSGIEFSIVKLLHLLFSGLSFNCCCCYKIIIVAGLDFSAEAANICRSTRRL
ncbi:PRA1 family protein A1-like isoform X2 [Mangifera indica]|uniref:PRA1 family protein A1-like isoform X2 n=1 Tax=Mangifera indica TaxID=29780 RepID=UPI001CF9F85F|nr:PRA1 family protein A1-like isoform X2 [Mangifera indica]